MAGPGRPPGGKKHGGRKTGTPNVVPAMVRDMIINVLMAEDHEAAAKINPWMADVKHEYKPVFAGLLSKILPKEMAVEIIDSSSGFRLNMTGLPQHKRAIESTLPALARIGVDDTEIVEGEVSSID